MSLASAWPWPSAHLRTPTSPLEGAEVVHPPTGLIPSPSTLHPPVCILASRSLEGLQWERDCGGVGLRLAVVPAIRVSVPAPPAPAEQPGKGGSPGSRAALGSWEEAKDN